MGEVLVALLSGGIEAHWIINTVFHGKWYFLVTTINAGTACIHQMLYRIVTAGLKDVVKTDDIALNVSVGILYTISDTA